MRQQRDRGPLALLGGLCLWLVASLAAPAAQGEEAEKKNFVVGKWAFARLSEAHELIGKGKLSEALKVMESMQRKKKLNEHERALMWQTFGYIHSAREQYKPAIAAFEKCLAINAMPEGAIRDTQFNLGQLYMASHDYKRAVRVLSDWIAKVEKPSPDSMYLLAMALTQTKDWPQALRWTKAAIASVKNPRETWLQLQLSIHFEMKQMKEVARMLERLVSRFPKKSYWLQLSAVYMELEKRDRAMAVLELCNQQGYLTTGSELKNLASLYVHFGIPIKAAAVLEQGIKSGLIERNEQNLTMQANALLRAREFDRALGPLADAAKVAKKGDLWVQVAQVHLERERWAKAAEALRAALAKGQLTSPGTAHLLLGIALFRNGKLSEARKALNRATEFKSAASEAKQWLKSIDERLSGQS